MSREGDQSSPFIPIDDSSLRSHLHVQPLAAHIRSHHIALLLSYHPIAIAIAIAIAISTCKSIAISKSLLVIMEVHPWPWEPTLDLVDDQVPGNEIGRLANWLAEARWRHPRRMSSWAWLGLYNARYHDMAGPSRALPSYPTGPISSSVHLQLHAGYQRPLRWSLNMACVKFPKT